MKKWLARIALAFLVTVLVLGGLFGLYVAHPGKQNQNIWPVHSNHLLVVMAVLIAWFGVAFLATYVVAYLIRALVKAAEL